MLEKIKQKMIKFHWVMSRQLGIDPLIFISSMRGVLAYLRDLKKFRDGYSGKINYMPCLNERYEEGGVTKSEYFWQDLLVARAIFEDQPVKHVDIGSRVDGFVAHVASFRECEVFDVRAITSRVPGVTFRKADIMDLNSLPRGEEAGYCDSLSCLHALEHFGLGRYGDPVNPHGYQRGLENMSRLLKPGGMFYLSTPVGQERVEFNANWIFDPRNIVRCAKQSGLNLKRLIVITPNDGPIEQKFDDLSLEEISISRYQLGLFVFTKL